MLDGYSPDVEILAVRSFTLMYSPDGTDAYGSNGREIGDTIGLEG